jgi:hypothetical protein
MGLFVVAYYVGLKGDVAQSVSQTVGQNGCLVGLF